MSLHLNQGLHKKFKFDDPVNYNGLVIDKFTKETYVTQLNDETDELWKAIQGNGNRKKYLYQPNNYPFPVGSFIFFFNNFRNYFVVINLYEFLSDNDKLQTPG
jgi:hypothetical protein